MVRQIGILISGDPGNSLGGCCQRDLTAMRKFWSESLNITEFWINFGFESIVSRSIQIAEKEETIFYFHYSGHGFNCSADEEIIIENKRILDNAIHDWLKGLPANSKVFLTFDSCHSGSMADISEKQKREPIRAKVFSIGACLENQLDQQGIGETLGFSGSLTIGIIEKCGSSFYENPERSIEILREFLAPLGQVPKLEKNY